MTMRRFSGVHSPNVTALPLSFVEVAVVLELWLFDGAAVVLDFLKRLLCPPADVSCPFVAAALRLDCSRLG